MARTYSRWLNLARSAASLSGDLPRLSNVDLDLLALAIGLELPLYTDDYRLQNTMQMAGLETHSVGTQGAKQVWRWELRCTGCGQSKLSQPMLFQANLDQFRSAIIAVHQ